MDTEQIQEKMKTASLEDLRELVDHPDQWIRTEAIIRYLLSVKNDQDLLELHSNAIALDLTAILDRKEFVKCFDIPIVARKRMMDQGSLTMSYPAIYRLTAPAHSFAERKNTQPIEQAQLDELKEPIKDDVKELENEGWSVEVRVEKESVPEVVDDSGQVSVPVPVDGSDDTGEVESDPAQADVAPAEAKVPDVLPGYDPMNEQLAYVKELQRKTKQELESLAVAAIAQLEKHDASKDPLKMNKSALVAFLAELKFSK